MLTRPAFGLTMLLACAPLCALAETAPSPCDRLAGYAATPRLPGQAGVPHILDAAAAIDACAAESAQHPEDAYLRLQFGRALLAADPADPEAAALFAGLRDSLPAIARLRLGALRQDSGDSAGAVTLYEEACALTGQPGAASACSNLALILSASDQPADRARVTNLLEAACAAGDTGGCLNLGVELDFGDLVEPDLARAAALYRQTCEAGEPLGCNNLGNVMIEGQVPGSAAEANDLFRRACAAGEMQGCGDLGVSYANGEGVDLDPAAAALLHGIACDGGLALGCANLAEAYRDGAGVPQDPARAFALMDRACDEGEGWGCVMQAGMLQERTGLGAAAPLVRAILARGCALGEDEACQQIGE